MQNTFKLNGRHLQIVSKDKESLEIYLFTSDYTTLLCSLELNHLIQNSVFITSNNFHALKPILTDLYKDNFHAIRKLLKLYFLSLGINSDFIDNISIYRI